MVLRLKLATKAALVAASLTAPVAPASLGEWARPETVGIASLSFSYRPAGEFSQGGRPVDAPWREGSTVGFEIMRDELSGAQYDACAAERVCPPRPASQSRDPRLPAVLINYADASAYAAWISGKTGEVWRLPSDAEWRVAAGSRARDDALGAGDASDRWLAKYDAESAAAKNDERLSRLGAGQANENGLYDLSGNVWEWTADCFVRYAAGPSGFRPVTTNCGVRVAEGEHRAYLTDFIRDARSGGCSAGKPPTYLGVRLVRETKTSGLVARLRYWLGAAI